MVMEGFFIFLFVLFKKYFGLEFIMIKKVIFLGFMFFCILFNYMILSDMKDVLVVMVKGSSVEIIFFLKMWVNLFMVIGFMVIYIKLFNILFKEVFFYMCIFFFIVFFGVFGFFMYFLVEFLYFMVWVNVLLEILGLSFLGLIVIVSNWIFCLFYVMVELWGSVVVFVFFFFFVFCYFFILVLLCFFFFWFNGSYNVCMWCIWWLFLFVSYWFVF